MSINIALCFDDRLQNYTTHVVNSIRQNTKEDVKFHFILAPFVSAKKIQDYWMNNIEVYENTRIPELDKVRMNNGVRSKAQYLRLLIPKLIKADKVIYLDNDIILDTDIKELYDIDIVNNVVAMALDPFGHELKDTQFFQGTISQKKYNLKVPSYLSGQMVINCDEWNRNDITETAIDIIQKNNVCDMIAINLACYGRIYKLDHLWNVPANYINNEGIAVTPACIHQNYSGGKLYHWHGDKKPWNSRKVFFYSKYAEYMHK